MTETGRLVPPEAASAGDAEAIRHLEQSIAGGKHWYLALLEAMGLWTSVEEVHRQRTYRYLIDREAFDWPLLAERLCATVEGRLPRDEKDALLAHGHPPLDLSAAEVRRLIGGIKYAHYLNYFYGVTVEGALLLAVAEDITKERRVQGYRTPQDPADEAYRRVYGATQAELLERCRREKGFSKAAALTPDGQKEFAYWLFKYRLKECEKARIASDTKKALGYLKRRWRRHGVSGALAASGLSD